MYGFVPKIYLDPCVEISFGDNHEHSSPLDLRVVSMALWTRNEVVPMSLIQQVHVIISSPLPHTGYELRNLLSG